MQGVNSAENVGFLARLARWGRERLVRDEFAAMPAGDIQRIAHDLSMDEAALRALASTPAGQADLMARMFAARGLDMDILSREEPELLRDMAALCGRCSDKRRCARDLVAGVDPHAAEAYCLNAGSFRLLET